MKVSVQVAHEGLRRFRIPAAQTFAKWAGATTDLDTSATVRVVDEDESHALNKRYRGYDKPTNVLAFPYEAVARDAPPYLGDIVITAPLVLKEAGENGVSVRAHWAHLFVHAVLHLLGYSHEGKRDTERMRERETEILNSLAIASPWR